MGLLARARLVRGDISNPWRAAWRRWCFPTWCSCRCPPQASVGEEGTSCLNQTINHESSNSYLSPEFLHDGHVAVHPVQAVRVDHLFNAGDAADDELGQVGLPVPRHEHEVVAENGGVLQDAPALQVVATLAAVRGTALGVEELGEELQKGEGEGEGEGDASRDATRVFLVNKSVSQSAVSFRTLLRWLGTRSTLGPFGLRCTASAIFRKERDKPVMCNVR